MSDARMQQSTLRLERAELISERDGLAWQRGQEDTKKDETS